MARGALVGGSEDDQEEKEREHDFRDEGGDHRVIAWRVRVITVRPKASETPTKPIPSWTGEDFTIHFDPETDAPVCIG